MRLFITSLLCSSFLIFAGCASISPKTYKLDQNGDMGLVVMSIGHSGDLNHAGFTLDYQSGPDEKNSGKITGSGDRIIRGNDFNEENSFSNLAYFSAKEGEYVLWRWTGHWSHTSGNRKYNYTLKGPEFLYQFEVKKGRVVYIGNFLTVAKRSHGKKYKRGQIVSDKSERDLKKFYEKFVNISKDQVDINIMIKK